MLSMIITVNIAADGWNHQAASALTKLCLDPGTWANCVPHHAIRLQSLSHILRFTPCHPIVYKYAIAKVIQATNLHNHIKEMK